MLVALKSMARKLKGWRRRSVTAPRQGLPITPTLYEATIRPNFKPRSADVVMPRSSSRRLGRALSPTPVSGRWGVYPNSIADDVSTNNWWDTETVEHRGYSACWTRKKRWLYPRPGTAQGEGISGDLQVLCQVLAEIFKEDIFRIGTGSGRFEITRITLSR